MLDRAAVHYAVAACQYHTADKAASDTTTRLLESLARAERLLMLCVNTQKTLCARVPIGESVINFAALRTHMKQFSTLYPPDGPHLLLELPEGVLSQVAARLDGISLSRQALLWPALLLR